MNPNEPAGLLAGGGGFDYVVGLDERLVRGHRAVVARADDVASSTRCSARGA